MHPKSFVGRAPPGPASGAYSVPHTQLDLRGLLLRKGRGREGTEGEGRELEGRGREGEGRGGARACPYI